MSQIFNRATSWIVRLPVLTCLLLAGITAIAILGYINPTFYKDLFQNENETSKTQNLAEEVFSTPPVSGFSFGADSVMVVESEQLFTPVGAAAMRQVVAKLESLDHVFQVTWMDQVPMLNIFGLPEPLLPHAQASQRRFDLAKQKALDHPFVHGRLLSSDAKTCILLLTFDDVLVIDDSQLISGIREVAESVVKEYPEFKVDFSVTGPVPIWITAKQTHDSNTFYFQLIGYSMIAVMSIVLFRGIAAAFVVGVAPAIAVFWTIGFVRFFDYQGNPFNEVVLPILVSLIALTDGVHLMVQIRKLRSQGLAPKDAAAEGIRQVGLACALTSLTTAIGFGSLGLASHTFVQQFGYCCVVGVILGFISVVTTIPLLCSSWLGKFVQRGQDKSLVDTNLEKIAGIIDFVLPRKRWIAITGVLLTVLFIAVSLGLRPDERQSSVIPRASEPAIALKKLDESMGGLETSEIEIRWEADIASNNPQILEVIEKVDDLLATDDLIGHPLSIADLIKALPGDGKTEDRMSMLELLPPPFKRAFFTPEYRTATTSFRVRDLGIAAYNKSFTNIQAGLAQIKSEHPKFSFEMQGDAVWRWENLYQIVVDLATSLGTATLIIFFVLALVYRSLTIGLISLVPNLFPLAVSGCFLVITGQALEVVTVCAFTVCLGIAVDDTIHFLTRYKEEQEAAENEAAAIRKAFTGVGTALILTTIVLVSGFCTVLSSDSRDHVIFASMGISTLTSALFADLVFLPALLAYFNKNERKHEAA